MWVWVRDKNYDLLWKVSCGCDKAKTIIALEGWKEREDKGLQTFDHYFNTFPGASTPTCLGCGKVGVVE